MDRARWVAYRCDSGKACDSAAALSVSEAGEDTTLRVDAVICGRDDGESFAAGQTSGQMEYILDGSGTARAGGFQRRALREWAGGDRPRFGTGDKQSRAFVVGNVLDEVRGNGTPEQTNGTRLWRYLAGDDWSAGERLSGRVRLFGSDEAFRQTFSSLNAARTVDTLTRVVKDETQDLGASGDVSYHRAHVALIAGAAVVGRPRRYRYCWDERPERAGRRA